MYTFFVILGFIFFLIFVSYPILIMPRMVHRPDYTPFDEHYYAHRGLHNNQGSAPENSLAAFSKAVEAGYGIELDIQLSKDQVPVVFHDYTLKRMCGVEGRVAEFTVEELQKLTLCDSLEHIPTLTQALSVIDGKVPLIIEFKIEQHDVALCPIAMEVLKQYKGAYCMESFHPFALRWFRKNHNEIMRGQLSTDFVKDKEKGNRIVYFALSRLLFNRIGKPDFIAYRHLYPHISSLAIVRDLYQLPIAAWTIKNQEELEEARPYFRYMIFDSFIPKK